jgi:hypothetical protein
MPIALEYAGGQGGQANSHVQSGDAERADIYEVAETSARAAIAAFQMEKATFIQTCSRRASEAEIEAANKEIEAANQQGWEAALKKGPEAALRFIGYEIEDPVPFQRRKFSG